MDLPPLGASMELIGKLSLPNLREKLAAKISDTLEEVAENFSASTIDIVAASRTLEEVVKSGVYFLLDRSEIVYVGQSKNVAVRLSSHLSSADISIPYKVTSATYIPVPVEELDLLESFYIQKFEPRGNRNKSGRISRSDVRKELARRLSASVLETLMGGDNGVQEQRSGESEEQNPGQCGRGTV